MGTTRRDVPNMTLKLKRAIERGTGKAKMLENSSNFRNSAHLPRNSLDFNIVEYVFFKNVFPCKEPGKRHLVWVTKN